MARFVDGMGDGASQFRKRPALDGLHQRRAALGPAPRPRAFCVGFDSRLTESIQRRAAPTHFDSPGADRRCGEGPLMQPCLERTPW